MKFAFSSKMYTKMENEEETTSKWKLYAFEIFFVILVAAICVIAIFFDQIMAMLK